ncbi:MAG: SDR family oxidoreductase [Phenylobacterium sp.]|nr:SDR family oxidoreductase [Phenylobacterium sp.]
MAFSLNGQRILIVGGGSGIGYAVAEGCLADGAVVTIASTGAERLSAAAETLGRGVSTAQLDVTNEPQVRDFFDGSERFDHIVTTAGDWGGPRRGALADLDLEAARGLFAVRFWGALALAKYGAPRLKEAGSLILTDGMVAHRPAPGAVVSSAMAGAVEHLTRALAVELAPLRVNAVCPGLILTSVWDNMPDRETRIAEMTRRQLIPRIGAAAEAAESYIYLMRNGFVTGQVLFVEGGSALARG